MTIAPIRTEADNEAALAEIETLFNAQPGTPEHDRLEVLTTLVAAFEDKFYPMNEPAPIVALRFRMEQGGYSPADFAALVGQRSHANEMLNNKRPLSAAVIRKLRDQWGMSADVLLGDSVVVMAKHAAGRGR